MAVARSRSSGLFGSGSDPHRPCLQPGGAGVHDLAVQQHHAFLAGIGIEAGIAEGEARDRVPAAASAAHPAAIARARRAPRASSTRGGSPGAPRRICRRGDRAHAGTWRPSCSAPSRSRNVWFRVQASSMPWEILPLMRAAAFLAGLGRADDRLRHQQSVPQVEPVQPRQVMRAGRAGRQRAGRRAQRADPGQGLVQSGARCGTARPCPPSPPAARRKAPRCCRRGRRRWRARGRRRGRRLEGRPGQRGRRRCARRRGRRPAPR